jgi:glucosyl-3-phosphoglycerate synthase
MAAGHDLLLIGVSARLGSEGVLLGPIAEEMMRRAPCGVVSLMAERRQPAVPDEALVGTRAISILVDKWFAENTYSSEEFADLDRLLALKQAQGVSISLALPALNEEGTVGKVIRTVRRALMDELPLLDEIVLVDSASEDRTREIAAQEGARVYTHQELLPAYGARVGKGEALWKSLFVTRGDIIAWVDTDIVNIHPRFVYGIVGPLLRDPRVQLVKGFYRRPLRVGDKLQAGAGGRVTELAARPLFNLFYPELSGLVQPLAGEYAGRRSALERVPFFSGYGVETGLLIDILDRFGLSAIAQVDLMERVHHNQPLEALGKMAFSIIQVVINRLEARTGQPMLEEVNKSMKLIRHDRRGYFLEVEEIAELDRPPMITLPEYRTRALPDGDPAT